MKNEQCLMPNARSRNRSRAKHSGRLTRSKARRAAAPFGEASGLAIDRRVLFGSFRLPVAGDDGAGPVGVPFALDAVAAKLSAVMRGDSLIVAFAANGEGD